MKTTDYLDEVKTRHNLESDYKLAKVLGIKQPTISHYRSGRSAMDATVALKIAELLALPPLQVIADAEIERARRDDVKKIWMRYAAALLMATGLGAAVTPPPVQASPISHNLLRVDNTNYARSRRRRSSMQWIADAAAALAIPAPRLT